MLPKSQPWLQQPQGLQQSCARKRGHEAKQNRAHCIPGQGLHSTVCLGYSGCSSLLVKIKAGYHGLTMSQPLPEDTERSHGSGGFSLCLSPGTDRTATWPEAALKI